MPERYTEWPCDPAEAVRAVQAGKTLLLEYVEIPCPMTLERALAYRDGWIPATATRRRRRFPGGPCTGRLGALQEYRAPDGSRYWRWVPVDDPDSWAPDGSPAPVLLLDGPHA